MTREEARKYLFSSGFSEEQATAIEKAFISDAISKIEDEIDDATEDLDGYDPSALGDAFSIIDRIFTKYKQEVKNDKRRKLALVKPRDTNLGKRMSE